MRISDWSSDVCSSDLDLDDQPRAGAGGEAVGFILQARLPSLRTTGASKRRPFDRLLSLVIVGHGVGRGAARPDQFELVIASCRERVCHYVWISVVAVS